MGLSGRVPHRVDAATKASLLDLIDQAVQAGWTIRRAGRVLELGAVRTHRWYARRVRGRLVDRAPGGSPVHGILPEEAAEILALFDQWGEVDRSHRKLAHRGSYLGRVWVSPSTVRRVLSLAGKHVRPCTPGLEAANADRAQSLATCLIPMIVDRSTCWAAATSATVTSWRTNCSQISYSCDGLNIRFARRFLDPPTGSFSDIY